MYKHHFINLHITGGIIPPRLVFVCLMFLLSNCLHSAAPVFLGIHTLCTRVRLVLLKIKWMFGKILLSNWHYVLFCFHRWVLFTLIFSIHLQLWWVCFPLLWNLFLPSLITDQSATHYKSQHFYRLQKKKNLIEREREREEGREEGREKAGNKKREKGKRETGRHMREKKGGEKKRRRVGLACVEFWGMLREKMTFKKSKLY